MTFYLTYYFGSFETALAKMFAILKQEKESMVATVLMVKFLFWYVPDGPFWTSNLFQSTLIVLITVHDSIEFVAAVFRMTRNIEQEFYRWQSSSWLISPSMEISVSPRVSRNPARVPVWQCSAVVILKGTRLLIGGLTLTLWRAAQ